MKQKFTLLLLALLTMSAATPAFAYDFEVDGIYYNISSSSEVTVTSKDTLYNCYNGEVTIPETVANNGTTYTVTSIEKGIFAKSKKLSLTLPATVELAYAQFAYVSGLVSVTAYVTSVPDFCFRECVKLTTVNLPNATKVGKSGFAESQYLKSVNLPKATTLGEVCFRYCTRLASVEVPNVTELGDQCFQYCDSLTTIELPNATEMGEECFDNCNKLASAKLPNVTKLEEGCFRDCERLTSIEIPNVTELGDECFMRCPSLTFINLPSVLEIGNDCFYSCRSLTSFKAPKVRQLLSRCFEWCTSLTVVELPNKVTYFGAIPFAFCPLTDFYITTLIPPTVDGESRNLGETTSFWVDDIYKYALYEECKLHVLESALEDYKATYPWSQFYSIDSDFTTLGVEDITIDKKINNTDIYDLGGRKQESLQRGVNIVGGQKVIVK